MTVSRPPALPQTTARRSRSQALMRQFIPSSCDCHPCLRCWPTGRRPLQAAEFRQILFWRGTARDIRSPGFSCLETPPSISVQLDTLHRIILRIKKRANGQTYALACGIAIQPPASDPVSADEPPFVHAEDSSVWWPGRVRGECDGQRTASGGHELIRPHRYEDGSGAGQIRPSSRERQRGGRRGPAAAFADVERVVRHPPQSG